MRWIAPALLSLLIMTSTGCGSDVTLVASTGTGTVVITTVDVPPPSITLAQFWQDTVKRAVYGSVDYYSPGSDPGTMTITVTDSHNVLVLRSVNDLAAFSGLPRGTIPFSINYASFPPDTYAFTIFITNRSGNLSNPLYGSFTAS